ncbi:histidine kinase dimerization/phosphoacceptor domain -containing protein [Henriciella marina]|uniref:histidine kinase dimerization/phosphoacceptor domain -containing protein n=1 Tax=Henriciella marina TaxID=453851 RepID=UPI0003803CB8|nr:histidine kinase dimerization/phosphoacceptor domain -containing protein [Henriciella marina]
MSAQPHPLQRQRIATLQRYEILDTPREQDFDEIVELASKICETPISVINMIDEHRQWFKAEVGLGTRETPLPTSICSHVILESDYVEIPDTLQDPRTADNELCLAPEGGLRFYAGYLLKPKNGLPLGTLCVLDHKPRRLTEFQKEALGILARRVMRELDLKLALREHEILRNEMDHRVKNSLQTVASYVRVYTNQFKKGEMDAATVLNSVASKIEAVSALHGALHKSADGQVVPLDGYLEDLVEYLRDSLPERVSIELRTAKAEVKSEVAGAVGIIVSEFVANSVKHGFPGHREGHVTIEAQGSGDDLVIRCADNGIGENADQSSQKEVAGRKPRNTGLGTRIVESAASRIGATIVRSSSSEGYTLELAIPAHARTH